MQKQKIIILAIGIVLAIIAVFMITVYLDQQRRLMQEKAKMAVAQTLANQTSVLVAKQDIPRGALIDADMLTAAIVPNQYLQPQVVTSSDRIAGMVTVASIAKGEQITLSKLAQAKQQAGGGLAEITPIGKRAITISVDNIASLVGMIRPGDYVDVIAMVPVPVQTADGKQATQVAAMPLFQNVLVLAIGQDTGGMPREGGSRYKKEETKEVSPLITLALGPQEANLIAFVQEQGKFRLVLRSPADSQIQPVQPASWDTLFQYIMPKDASTKPEVAKEQPATNYIEIYRGLSKERVPISK